LKSNGVPKDKYVTLETKNIGLRMQMLLSGQVEAATLPEPLVTAAIAKGAVLLADDSGLAASQTILAFSGSFLTEHGQSVKAFLKALEEAGALINANPEGVRSIMVEHVRVPDAFEGDYPCRVFRSHSQPTLDNWIRWFHRAGDTCATGAAIACSDRPVIDLQADGSGLYTVQALWTQAREGLNVTTLICSNRSYRILQMELSVPVSPPMALTLSIDRTDKASDRLGKN